MQINQKFLKTKQDKSFSLIYQKDHLGASHICKSIDQRAKNALARTYMSVDSRFRGNDSCGSFCKIERHPVIFDMIKDHARIVDIS